VNLPMILFVLLALLIIFLLAWVTRPPRLHSVTPDNIFGLLSQPRHCARLHFILQALRPEDTEFLAQMGNAALMRGIRVRRRQIALAYLDCLEEEFETLLEISRAIAIMAPEVIAMEEMSRWKLSLLFSVKCALLRGRLRLGLRPLSGFVALSTLATGMVRHLEAATSSIAEHTALGGGLPGLELSGPDAE